MAVGLTEGLSLQGTRAESGVVDADLVEQDAQVRHASLHWKHSGNQLDNLCAWGSHKPSLFKEIRYAYSEQICVS